MDRMTGIHQRNITREDFWCDLIDSRLVNNQIESDQVWIQHLLKLLKDAVRAMYTNEDYEKVRPVFEYEFIDMVYEYNKLVECVIENNVERIEDLVTSHKLGFLDVPDEIWVIGRQLKERRHGYKRVVLHY